MKNHKYITILAVVFVTGCAGIQFDGLDPIQKLKMEFAYAKAAKLEDQAHYMEASQVLWTTAQELPSPHKELMQIESARALIKGQHLLNAHKQLLSINEQHLQAEALLNKRVLSAGFYQQIRQPEKVIALLPEELIENADKELKIEALKIRADGLKNVRRYIESLKTYIEVKSLSDAEDKVTNTKKIWETLITINPSDAKTQLLREPESRELKAWLELALIATPVEVNTVKLEQDYQEWLRNNTFLETPDYIYQDLLVRWAYFDFNPKKITLLLPLTGDYANIGRIIKDGFFHEHQKTSSTIEVNLFNTDQDKNIIALYDEASLQGADMIIGPLLKQKVNTLLAHRPLQTPLITLNYQQHNSAVEGEVFQFGLNPEDEAIQVARKLLDKEYDSIVVLSPDDEWGKRMTQQFSQTYRQSGGKIRETHYYDVNFKDYAAIIQSLFHLDESRQRHREIEEVLEKKVEFTPRIRDDINAAMLFANHEKASLIYPLMKFYYADELPVYATSHVYEPGKEEILRELDGLIYSDIPFMLDSEHYPSNKQPLEYPRLFALGADAYRLINSIRRISISNTELAGATGYLSTHNNARLFRRLSWAKFVKGEPVALGQNW